MLQKSNVKAWTRLHMKYTAQMGAAIALARYEWRLVRKINFLQILSRMFQQKKCRFISGAFVHTPWRIRSILMVAEILLSTRLSQSQA